MSDTNTGAASTRAKRKPDHVEPSAEYGEIAVWVDKRTDGKGYSASIATGKQGEKQWFKAKADIPGLDGHLSAQEIAIIFDNREVVATLQPSQPDANPYEVSLVRKSKFFEKAWASDATKVDRHLDIAIAYPVMMQRRIPQKDEAGNFVLDEQGKKVMLPVIDENEQPVMKLSGYKVDKVLYPAWHKHGTDTWIGPVDARGAVRLACGEELTDLVNGVEYTIKCTGLFQSGKYTNAKFAVTKAGELQDRAADQVVDEDSTCSVGQGVSP
jgi:hypothetical protein